MKRIFLLAVLSLIAVLAYADDVKTANAIILSDNTVFDVSSLSSGTLKSHVKVMVFNDKGLRSALFRAYVDPFRTLTSFSGKIEAGGKTIRKLKSSDLTTVMVAEGVASDAYVTFYEPEAPYPFTVEYDYEISYRKGFVSFPVYYPVISSDVSVTKASYSISLPSGMSIQYNSSKEPEKVTDGKKDVYVWSFDRYPGYVYEHMMPEEQEFVPYVYSAPVNFEYAGYKGVQTSWKETGEWLYSLQKDAFEVPDELRHKVQELVAGVTADKEKIRILYDFLRENTRYVSIQLGIGGYRPFSVSTVFKTGFGDCKALSVYMQALLSIAGIKSEYFVVHTDNEELLSGFHSIGQMNHAMLCVPMKSDTLWIECTNARYPLGYRHSSIAGHQVLLVKEEGGEMVRVSDYPDSLRLKSETVDVELMADGTAVCKGQRRLVLNKVEPYIGFRSLDAKAQFRAIMSGNSFNPTDFTILSVEDNFNDWTSMEPDEEYIPELRICYSYTVKDYAKAAGDRIFMDMNPFAKKLYSDRSPRINDMVINSETTLSDTVRINLPAGYIPESLPASGIVESQFGCLATEVTQSEDQSVVTIVQTFRFYPGRFPKEVYADYRTFARSVSRIYDAKIVLVRK